ncbi:MAG: FtsW/RodA/SpoVE family cell cycle protein [Hyphomicrobiaceae bacterium]
MRILRSDRSLLAEWWFTFDRVLLAAILALVLAGIVLSFAASPAVAVSRGLPAFYYAERHIMFAALGVFVMIAVSLLSPRAIRRLALILFAGSIAAMVLVLMTGDQINGARRWLRLAGFSLQPSEFAKPAFAVLCAWAFAESERRNDVPALPVAALFLLVFAGLLIMQPDVGQTILIGAVWTTMFVLTGRSLLWGVGLAGVGAGGLGIAYFTLPYVQQRFDRFFSGGPESHSQLARAFQSFQEGGLFGRGPGEGTIKTILPDAHTDFPFAVVGEEYGAIACLVLVVLFAVVVLRPLARAVVESDAFIRHATTALALMIGLQALINMSVSIGLVPAKGMTLPFISAGGSSMLAISISCGMLIALTRRRADRARLKSPRLRDNAAAGLQRLHSRI